MMFTLVYGRRIYLSLFVANRIKQADVCDVSASHDPFPSLYCAFPIGVADEESRHPPPQVILCWSR
jgi:hypothetical protein